ncbi:MAG: MotA/TolQ/ExbB proton channel family protein [Candidatus Ancaeobacter aquaticus]|nr:MotA/TolQ/ExbB proton channel family protein [Candidatus Ancaeobacter aquaticus]
MLDIFILGGPVMVFIGLISIVAFAVFMYKTFHLRRAQIDTQKFMNGLANVIKKKNHIEAITICNETPGPISAVLRAGLLKYQKSEDQVRKAMEVASLNEIPRLEKDTPMLLNIAYVAPLFGFLGTIIGLIKVFMRIQERGGIFNASDIAGGVWESLLCSAAGIVVAIPSFLAYNYLMNRAQLIVLDMERSATELVAILFEKEEDV